MNEMYISTLLRYYISTNFFATPLGVAKMEFYYFLFQCGRMSPEEALKMAYPDDLYVNDI